ncbi:hypothetical protein [Streptomyces sp. NPDC087297]|uniref:hypothetical protein n=1 Tax=Streptomyces sp. NPDC087297 TaxID=3365778 RepID=UPI00380DFAEC
MTDYRLTDARQTLHDFYSTDSLAYPQEHAETEEFIDRLIAAIRTENPRTIAAAQAEFRESKARAWDEDYDEASEVWNEFTDAVRIAYPQTS